jgi:hypothetical protein
MRPNLTPEEVTRIEIVQTLVAVVAAGGFLMVCGLPFFSGGQLLLTLVGSSS